MNHYPHHLGDYAKKTLGFTQGEHGAYRLLLDAYYATEQPLPAGDVYTIAKATNAAERKNTDKALKKFDLRDGLYYHERAEEELAAYRVRADSARENGKKPKKKRAGIPSAYPAGKPEASDPVSGSAPTGQAESKLTSNQKKQPPKNHILGDSSTASPERCAALTALCVASRVETDVRAGLYLRQWAEEGVTDQQLIDAIAIAREQKPHPAVIPVKYLAAIVPDVRSGKAGTTLSQAEVIARTIARVNAEEAGNVAH